MPQPSPTQAIATALRRLWAAITLADASASFRPAIEADLNALAEERRIRQFWHDIEQAGIVTRQTDRGWTFHHRAVPAAEAWQPDPFATRETALVWAVYYLMRYVHFLRLDVAADAPSRPNGIVASLDAVWPALEALGLIFREQANEQYWRAVQLMMGLTPEAAQERRTRSRGWFYSHPLLPRPPLRQWKDAAEGITHLRRELQGTAAPFQPPPTFTCWGPYGTRDSALLGALTGLFAQVDALQPPPPPAG